MTLQAVFTEAQVSMPRIHPITRANAFANAATQLSYKPGSASEGYLGEYQITLSTLPTDKKERRLCELYAAEAISGRLCPASIIEKAELEAEFRTMDFG